MQVEVERTAESGAESAGVHVQGASQRVCSTLSLVDLAGSERQAFTGAKGIAMKESIEINTSLFVLRKVIQALALVSGRRGGGATPHIPFRDSKLTSLLKHSLGGNSLTLMIACCSPSDAYIDENLSTLQYASTAKRIANKPVINEDANTRLIRKLKEEILMLREQLAQAQTLAGIGGRGGQGQPTAAAHAHGGQMNGGAGSEGGAAQVMAIAAGSGGGGDGGDRGRPLSSRRGGDTPASSSGREVTSGIHPFDTDYGACHNSCVS